jgi:hypothetical protein
MEARGVTVADGRWYCRMAPPSQGGRRKMVFKFLNKNMEFFYIASNSILAAIVFDSSLLVDQRIVTLTHVMHR